ncbi:MAG: hypothetical protein ACE37H_13235 [Phycisphaeraceae bacterium]
MATLSLSDPEHGWIDITFSGAQGSYQLTASDVPNDCLSELASAVVHLSLGSDIETAYFSLEPGFATCRMQREADVVTMTLSCPNVDKPVFLTKVALVELRDNLRTELLRIKQMYSADDGWGQPFPAKTIENLAD